jgi:hypothetical protein
MTAPTSGSGGTLPLPSGPSDNVVAAAQQMQAQVGQLAQQLSALSREPAQTVNNTDFLQGVANTVSALHQITNQVLNGRRSSC